MIQRTRSDVENGMRANACPSDKAEGKGERRSGHATSSIQKGKERKNSIEFVEEGRGLPSYLCIKDANRYLSILPFQGGGAATPVSRGYTRNLNSISPWYFK